MTRLEVMETEEFKSKRSDMEEFMIKQIEAISSYALYEYKYIENYEPYSVNYCEVLSKKHIFNYEVKAPNITNRTYSIKIMED